MALLLQIGQLLLQAREAAARGVVRLLAQRLALDLQLHDAAFDLVELHRQRVDLGAQLRGRLVDEIDGLVRQETVADVAVGEHRGGDQGGVLELHAVVDLVPLAQAAQDADGVLDRGLGDEHRLEAPLERRVLLDVLAVLVQGRRPDGVQLAPGEQRLEHVRGVYRALGRARADHRVQLVDEEHDAAVGVGDLLEHCLQPLLELAAVLGAGDEGSHVEGDQTLVLESLGDVSAHDALGQPLHDRGLADPRLTDEDRVVLGPAREHLDDPPDLFVPADDRIEPGAAGQRGQIAGVALERLVLPFGMLVGHPVRAADGGQRLVEPVLAHPVPGQQARRRGGAAARSPGPGRGARR